MTISSPQYLCHENPLSSLHCVWFTLWGLIKWIQFLMSSRSSLSTSECFLHYIYSLFQPLFCQIIFIRLLKWWWFFLFFWKKKVTNFKDQYFKTVKQTLYPRKSQSVVMCLWLDQIWQEEWPENWHSHIMGTCLSACAVCLCHKDTNGHQGSNLPPMPKGPGKLSPRPRPPCLHGLYSHAIPHQQFFSPSPALTTTITSERSSSLSLIHSLLEMWLWV